MGAVGAADKFVPLVPARASCFESRPSIESELSYAISDSLNQSSILENHARSRRVRFGTSFTPSDEESPCSKSSLLPPRSLTLPILAPRRTIFSRCRLIGFTPLNEVSEVGSPPDVSAQFLGPKQVKAKEVAPCALLYKREDVFVSNEMKTENLFSHCNSHYENMRFEDESSSPKEVVHAPSSNSLSDTFHSQNLKQSEGPRPTNSGGTSNDDDEVFTTFNPVDMVQEAISQLFVGDGLTTKPQFESTLTFYGDQFNDSLEDGRTLARLSQAEFVNAESTSDVYDLTEKTNPMVSENSCSSAIQSSLWEVSTLASTRATSPVSSLYSNISTSCHSAKLTTAQLNHPDFQSNLSNRTKLGITNSWTRSHRGLRSRRSQSSTLGVFRPFTKLSEISALRPQNVCHAYECSDQSDDHGSLADDEGEKDSCHSHALESDDEQGWLTAVSCSKISSCDDSYHR
ncbi:expressed protein [Phakopsora pachyrhizi]|uniref:Expressed protein n=1 Tax=Phakopsora pachyrhizi TaxID=170000 RepID=A0AAV0BT66_PHAPC|nr:expressed protein [Phakopsora pachyrhizi]